MNTVPHHAKFGKTYTIYALVDPRNYSTRYVGMSTNVERRFQQHLNCADGNPEKDAWIRELQSVQLVPQLKCLEEVETLTLAKKREQHWIHHYLHIRMPLTNVTQIGRRFTEEETNRILDHYLLTGELPKTVSKRSQRDWKRHKRLPERRLLLDFPEVSR